MHDFCIVVEPSKDYLNPIEACQTKANKRKNTGIAGITSTSGRKIVYGSGKADNRKFISILSWILIY